MALASRLPALSVAPAKARAIGLPATVATKVVLLFLVVSVFLEKYELEGYGSGSLPLPDFFFMVAAGLLAIKLLVDTAVRLASPRAVGGIDLALVGLALLLGLLSLWPAFLHDHVSQTSKTFLHLIALLSAALVMGRSLNQETREFTLKAFFVTASIVAAIGLLQAVDQNVTGVGFADLLGLRSRESSGFIRPISIMSEPAYLGYVSLMGALVGLWAFQGKRSRLCLAGLTACLAAFILTAALGPLLFAGCLAGFYLLTGRVTLGLRMLPVAIALITVALLTPAVGVVFERLDEVAGKRDASATARGNLSNASIQIWQREPLTGVGLGNSRYYLAEYVHLPGASQPGYEFPAANVYLGLLGETGPIGVVALVAVLVLLIGGKASLRDKNSQESLIRIQLLLVAMQFLVIGAFLLPTFWFWSGMRLSLPASGSEEKPGD